MEVWPPDAVSLINLPSASLGFGVVSKMQLTWCMHGVGLLLFLLLQCGDLCCLPEGLLLGLLYGLLLLGDLLLYLWLLGLLGLCLLWLQLYLQVLGFLHRAV